MKKLFYFLIVFSILNQAWAGPPQVNKNVLFLAHFDKKIDADFAKGNPKAYIHQAKLTKGRWGKGLDCHTGSYASFEAKGNIYAKEGTITFLVKPLWDKKDQNSHTFLSLRWNYPPGAYLVITKGWWEPEGKDWFYFIFNNQLYLHTEKKIRLPLDNWTHIACSWDLNPKGGYYLFINGDLVASGKIKEQQWKKFNNKDIYPVGQMFVGSDLGTPLARNRFANAVIDELTIYNKRLSETEIKNLYHSQEPKWKEIKWSWLIEVIRKPYKPLRNANGHILESRAIFDEGTGWMTKKGADAILNRIKEAGFNVYVPCVWHGRGTRFISKVAPWEKGLIKSFQKNHHYPLKYLVKKAHEMNIQVHPWFCVVLRQRDFLSNFYDPEHTPKKAFDVHRPGFRKFIVNLILEVVKNYNIDGINLDYIRTMGVCTCEYCIKEYEKLFHRNLRLDLLNCWIRRGLRKWPEPHLLKWQREVIADIVKTISEKARKIKPNIIISVDGHPAPEGYQPNIQGRDEITWANKGWIDIVFAMDYGRHIKYERWDKVRKELKKPSALIVLCGNYERTKDKKVVSREADLVAAHIAYCQRKWPGNGVALYLQSMLSDEQIKALKLGPFKESALPFWK